MGLKERKYQHWECAPSGGTMPDYMMVSLAGSSLFFTFSISPYSQLTAYWGKGKEKDRECGSPL